MNSIKKSLEKVFNYIKKYTWNGSVQATIAISFTVVSVILTSFLGFTLYQSFANRMKKITLESTEKLLNQTAANFNDYLKNMRRISDAMYYSVIKDKDVAVDSFSEEMNLFYEENKDKLISIACYTRDGELISAAPVMMQKKSVQVQQQEWFSEALKEMENLHFSNPHVQNIFDDGTFRYFWVVSLSRTVELTDHGNSELGVLLVDMNYSNIQQLLEKTNSESSSEYVYLMDGNGELIYHPKQDLISSDLFHENNLAEASYGDGSHEESFEGIKRLVTVKTISYTGWKLVSVAPMSYFNAGLMQTRYFVILVVSLVLLALLLINQLVSARITRPLRQLNDSIKEWETGNLKADFNVVGPSEIEHLGRTLNHSVEEIRQLMSDILIEQEAKRKSELDALQSQINPHFLYNTLDSIVWMIEGGKNKEAVFMITQLASLFRISLSQGRTIIAISDEVKHAQNYMNIQKIRYKNAFEIRFDIDPEILECKTVKLVIQPLLENAIYYGVGGMEDEGEILVKGYRTGNDLSIDVIDNGLGMREEEVQALLTDESREHSHGSGVGLVNVHSRIKLYFGEQYGLEIISRPDEGTIARIHLPFTASEEPQKGELP